jgi:hypothetical protein
VEDSDAPFRYQNDVVERLPDPPGYEGNNRPRLVHGIDAAGNIVGKFQRSDGYRAVRWTQTGVELLQLPNDGVVSFVEVSPGGIVAISGWPFSNWTPAWEGEYGWGTGRDAEPDLTPGRDPMQTYLWREGVGLETMPALLAAGSLNAGTRAEGINDAGAIAYLIHSNFELRAARFDSENGLVELPTLGASLSGPLAINESGDMVGIVRARSGTDRAVLWRGARAYELPPPPGFPHSSPIDLNDRGEVLGKAYNDSMQGSIVVWRDARPVELADFLPPGSGWELVRAYAINEAGQALVKGLVAGAEELFLFTPTGPYTTTGGDVR